MPNGSERRYWALLGKPTVYDLEGALREVDTDAWTVKKSAVKKGDRVVLWRGQKDGVRGVVGLGEVVSDPEPMLPPTETLRFWNVSPPQTAERRAWVRSHPLESPLWLPGRHAAFLRTLTVSRGQGTVFRVSPAHWAELVRRAGGWRDSHPENQVSERVYLVGQRELAVGDSVREVRIRQEQQFLRARLLQGRTTGACYICGKDFPVDLLVAAHVKHRAICKEDERRDYQHNVKLMCRLGCDYLFERGYVSVKNGAIAANRGRLEAATGAVRAYLEAIAGRSCRVSEREDPYFSWHWSRHGF